MQRSTNTRKYWGTLLVPLAAVLLILSSCSQPYVTPTITVTPVPSLNLTPANNAEATLFPVIATYTAVVGEMYKTLAPINQTLAPMVATSTAIAVASNSVKPAGSDFGLTGMATWLFLWLLPVTLLSISAFYFGEFRLQPFILFFSYPRHAITTFLEDEIDADQFEQSGFKRLLILLNRWNAIPDSKFVVTLLSMILGWLLVLILTWPSINFVRSFPLELLAATMFYLTVAAVGINMLLSLAGKALGISWYASLGKHSRELYSEELLTNVWTKILASWSIGLPILLVILIWPGPLLVPRSSIALMALFYFVMLGRQLAQGVDAPKPRIVLHILFTPIQMIGRRILFFSRQTYLFNETTSLPNLKDGRLKLVATALLVFMWLSLSGDEFWRWMIPLSSDASEWLILSLQRIQSYYLPSVIESSIKDLAGVRDLRSSPMVPIWLMEGLERPGVFSAIVVLLVGWAVETIAWFLSSTITGLSTGLKRFKPSDWALQAAWHFVTSLVIFFIYRALFWSILSVSSISFLLPVADILFAVCLVFWLGGWVVLGIRSMIIELQEQRYYLLPVAALGGLVLGPVWGHLKATLMFAWLVGNLPGLWLAADSYLPKQVERFLERVLDTQSAQLNYVLSLEHLWVSLPLAFLFAFVILYGAIGMFLRVRANADNQGGELFLLCTGIQATLFGWSFAIWGAFSATLNLTGGLWNIRELDQLLPFVSFAVFGLIYVILLKLDAEVKEIETPYLFVYTWLWPFLYWLPRRWNLRSQLLDFGIDYQHVGAFFKFLFMPYPRRSNKWSDTVPDTPFYRSLLSGSSLELPYHIALRWRHLAGAGFSNGQALVYFVIDTFASAMIWPWLPSAASWLTGTSLIKDPLLVKPNAVAMSSFNVFFSQALLLVACVFWAVAFSWLTQVFTKDHTLVYERSKSIIYRYIGNLILTTSACHLLFLPVHMAVVIGLKDLISRDQMQFLGVSISVMLNLSTILVFIVLARTTLQKQLTPIGQTLRDGFVSSTGIPFRPTRFFRFIWNSISPLTNPLVLRQENSATRIIWISLFIQIIGLGLGWVGWKLFFLSNEPGNGIAFLDFARTWVIRLTGLSLAALLMAAISLPFIHNQAYQICSTLYRGFALPISFLESSTGQLPFLPRIVLRAFHTTLNPRHLIYPGYRHVMQNMLLAVWFSNSLLSLIMRPLEASLGQPSANALGAWGLVELGFTIILASYLSANLTRVIPLTAFLGGIIAALLLTHYAHYLRIIAIIITGIALYAIAATSATSSFNSLFDGVQHNWYLALSRFKAIESKWLLMETFFQLDDDLLGQGNNLEPNLMKLLHKISGTQLYVRIRSGIYEEDPLVQTLRTYFKYSRESAEQFVNSLLFTSQPAPSLEGIIPEVRTWLFEAAIGVRFIEMQKTSENYLATLMQLRAAGLWSEVGATFNETPVWQPLPLPVEFVGVSRTDEDRRVGEPVLPKKILKMIRVYTDPDSDLDEAAEAWDQLQPSMIAEEVLQAFNTLNIMLDTRSLTEIAALTFSDQQVFWANYSYMVDLTTPITSLAEVAETIARAEELATQDRPQFYVSALQQLQRLQSLIDSEVRDPEQRLFAQCVFLWNTMLTEALSTTIIPQSRIEVEIEQFEREWEQEEVVVLVISNHAQGTAYNLHVQIKPGTGYEVLEPQEGIHIETLPGQSDAKAEFRLQINMKDDVWVNFHITYDDAGQPNHILDDKKLVQFVPGANEDVYQLTPVDFDTVRNPYHYGLPITDPGLFFGRSDIMNKIRQIITSTTQTNIVMLYGQRRMGKSTILRQLLQQTRNMGEFWPIFIDIEMFTLSGTSGFLWELAHEIWRELPDGHCLPEPKLEDFQISPGTYLIKEWIPLVDEAISARGCALLLLLDEFDLIYQNPRFQDKELSEILGIIRGMGHERQKGGIIYVGTYRLLEMTSLYQTPLFNQAVPIRVSFLDDDATQLLIRQPARGLLKYDANAVAKIMRLTGNHPYYLQLICSSIFERAMNFKTRTVNVSRVIDALEQAQQQGGLILDYLWKENTPLQKYVIGTLARLNEHETSRASISRVQRELSAFMIDVSADEVQKSIEALSQWEIIMNENGQYRFTVDLFRLWLREHKTLASIRAEVGSLSRMTR